jgi:hypothetical protein
MLFMNSRAWCCGGRMLAYARQLNRCTSDSTVQSTAVTIQAMMNAAAIATGQVGGAFRTHRTKVR